MDRLLAMSVFSAVVEQGSFAKAATRLNMSTSAVSRHVSDLEAHLNTRLLNRTTRRLSLTESGSVYVERANQLLADLDDTESLISSNTGKLQGTIRLTCSVAFGVRHLAVAIAAFQQQYPDVKFDCSLSDGFVDLVDAGLDLAVRVGDSGNPNLIARKIGTTQLILCASPAYLKHHGAPTHPDDLAKHNCLTYEYGANRNTWHFKSPDKKNNISCKVTGSLHANNGRMLAAAAEQGVGVIFAPDFIIGSYLKNRQLIPLLSDFMPPPIGIYAVYTSRRHLSAKLRTFIDFLVTHFAKQNDWA